jgi:hypothetical protein
MSALLRAAGRIDAALSRSSPVIPSEYILPGISVSLGAEHPRGERPSEN